MPAKKTKKTLKNKPKELANTRVKINFSKHILPPLAGFAVFIFVFGFLNSELISGKIAYYMYTRHAKVAASDTQTAITPVDVNGPFKLTINKINITAPIIDDQKTVNERAFQKSLQKGVVHYPSTALPGQKGNVVIFGHSSGQWWAPGDYKFIFTLLNQVTIDDKIFVEYQGVRYIYRVNDVRIVDPTDLSVLNQNDNRMLTLITCTPVGSSAKRLIVQAQQVAPVTVPATDATSAATQPKDAQGHTLPSHSQNFVQDFLDLFN